jgi:hypothetical protein
MKRFLIAFVGTVLAGLWLSVVAAPGEKSVGTLHHVVVFKFKTNAPPASVQQVEASFEALQTKIPQVKTLNWGTNVSPEHLNKGFTHCFSLTFKSDADRDAYLVHPAHKEFGAGLGPVLDDVLVIDFWSKP